MALIKKLQSINLRTKHSVFGFIHEAESSFSSNEFPSKSIPISICYLCLWYYYGAEPIVSPYISWFILQSMKRKDVMDELSKTVLPKSSRLTADVAQNTLYYALRHITPKYIAHKHEMERTGVENMASLNYNMSPLVIVLNQCINNGKSSEIFRLMCHGCCRGFEQVFVIINNKPRVRLHHPETSICPFKDRPLEIGELSLVNYPFWNTISMGPGHATQKDIDDVKNSVKFKVIIESHHDRFINNYKYINYIQHGTFARVYAGYNLKHSQFVAIKHNLDVMDHDKETKILEKLHHHHIVRFMEEYQFKFGHVIYNFIVLELCVGDLYSFFVDADRRTGKVLAKRCITDIIPVLNYLYESHIAHCDIKMENILISIDMELKLTDFGAAISLLSGDISNGGTPPFFNINDKSDNKTDVFALGIVMLELLCDGLHCFGYSQDTYDEKEDDEKDDYIQSAHKTMYEITKTVTDGTILHMISQMIAPETQRVSADKLLNCSLYSTLTAAKKSGSLDLQCEQSPFTTQPLKQNDLQYFVMD